MPVHEFKVAMTCSGCSGAVERVLNKIGNDVIQNVEINLENKTVQVTSELSSDEILQIIKKTGKEASFIGLKD